MHSMLGLSGNIGGTALHRLIRRLYVPIESGHWPDEKDWLTEVRTLTAKTVQALQLEAVE